MIAKFAYLGTKPIYKAFFGDKVIWNYGEYTSCISITEFLSSVDARTADAIRTACELSGVFSSEATPNADNISPVVFLLDSSFEASATPAYQYTVSVQMASGSNLTTSVCPIVYGIVFGAGIINSELETDVSPRIAGAVRAFADLPIVFTSAAIPAVEAPSDITAHMLSEFLTNVSADAEGPVVIFMGLDAKSYIQAFPKLQDSNDVALILVTEAYMNVAPAARTAIPASASISSQLEFVCAPYARDVWEYPVQTDNVLYIPQVYSAEQNGNILTLM